MIIKPKVILFRGLPGVGKTYLSSLISRENKIAVIRKDDIYDLIDSALESHDEKNKICYAIIYKMIDTNLKARINMIVDSPFRAHADLDALSEYIEERGGLFKPILCDCRDEKLWEERFNNRGVKPNNIITRYSELKSHYKIMQLDKYKRELVIDTQENVLDLVLKINDYIFKN